MKSLPYMAFAIVVISIVGLKFIPEYSEFLKYLGVGAFGYLFGLPVPSKGE